MYLFNLIIVVDLLFLENVDIVFKVALALLTLHKDNLLMCDSFEEIMNYLKVKLPAIDKSTLDKIIKQVSKCEVAMYPINIVFIPGMYDRYQ
jgi:TBC1 domain family member 4